MYYSPYDVTEVNFTRKFQYSFGLVWQGSSGTESFAHSSNYAHPMVSTNEPILTGSLTGAQYMVFLTGDNTSSRSVYCHNHYTACTKYVDGANSFLKVMLDISDETGGFTGFVVMSFFYHITDLGNDDWTVDVNPFTMYFYHGTARRTMDRAYVWLGLGSNDHVLSAADDAYTWFPL